MGKYLDWSWKDTSKIFHCCHLVTSLSGNSGHSFLKSKVCLHRNEEGEPFVLYSVKLIPSMRILSTIWWEIFTRGKIWQNLAKFANTLRLHVCKVTVEIFLHCLNYCCNELWLFTGELICYMSKLAVGHPIKMEGQLEWK